ncbi:hypothetical protein BRO54_3895 [Geobacillus proteiniphilus]|uniref:Uncharacterized protein n=1 Tax=Geobacillus proteiniphilus TaxID=860353 RepID=A0A1Q5SBS9_9BACL|nr:hypothetical protein BRO54_3895 [Geobacillus proteiniphilus]
MKNIWLRDRQDGDISPLPAGRGLPLGEITALPLFSLSSSGSPPLGVK